MSSVQVRNVAVLGATGSIGASALDVIARHPDRLRASVLAAGNKVDALLALCTRHRPRHAVIADTAQFAALRDGLRQAGLDTQAHAGEEAITALAGSEDCDTVLAAIVGAAGLPSTLAQLGLPDMRTALAVGFAWPERIVSGVAGLDLLQHGKLEFEAPDLAAFPCLRLAFDALQAGGTAPAMLNAANEVAVSAFLQRRIGFLSISDLVEATMNALPVAAADSLERLHAADADARRHALSAIPHLSAA
jgi:1-deoxy-D-xylulose 5-phosphate reductoisomerase